MANPSVNDIQRATLAARARTGDRTISTTVKAGLIRVVRVIPRKARGGCDVLPLTPFLPAPEAVAALHALGQ